MGYFRKAKKANGFSEKQKKQMVFQKTIGYLNGNHWLLM